MHYQEVSIPTDHQLIKGNLTLIKQSRSLVVFAHGSGSSRFSKRNQYVASILQQGGLSTFLFDLLTAEEERIDAMTREFRFDIPLLTDRLIIVTRWLLNNPQTADLVLGYFGSSTGAAAALIAAAKSPDQISAVVSRGGRVDLAEKYLPDVQAPSLFIVGSQDYEVLALNRDALQKLACPKELLIIPGATHLFEEEGALEQVAQGARDWFTKYLFPT